jgi:DNA-binding MarR family transcriptional regulator
MPLFSSIKRAIALSARSGQAIDLHGTFSCEQGIRFISFYDILSRDLSVEEYQAPAEFRYQIRRFLYFNEEQARAHGLEPQQQQLLLAIKALPEGAVASVGELAGRLRQKHHSVVELIDRLEKQAYVVRETRGGDRRQAIVRLTASGSSVLRALSVAHHQELDTAGPELAKALRSIARQHQARRRGPAASDIGGQNH